MSEPQKPLVEIRGLTRQFHIQSGLFSPKRSMTAVREVNLSIAKGRTIGVVGESGCGKSTLARLVLRLLTPSAGSVLFDGVDLGGLTASQLRQMRRRMQMVFQDPYSAIDPRYTMEDALLEPFQIQGIALPGPKRRETVSELLDMVGLNPQMASSYPHQLSGGQRQRIGIARALALKPDFIVLDEPTASLDVSIQAQIIGLLDGLKRDLALTYLFISHDLGLVRYFCDQIVVMYLGSIVEILPDPKSEPRHPYTRVLMDSTFSPDPARRRTVTMMSGDIPNAFDMPVGCAFAGRCNRAEARCRSEVPALAAGSDGHSVACFNPIPASSTSPQELP